MTRTASNRHVLIAEGPESLVVSESEKVVVIEVSFYRLGGVLFIFTIILSISHACHGNKRILILSFRRCVLVARICFEWPRIWATRRRHFGRTAIKSNPNLAPGTWLDSKVLVLVRDNR
jgi:hypothetical protein